MGTDATRDGESLRGALTELAQGGETTEREVVLVQTGQTDGVVRVGPRDQVILLMGPDQDAQQATQIGENLRAALGDPENHPVVVLGAAGLAVVSPRVRARTRDTPTPGEVDAALCASCGHATRRHTASGCTVIDGQEGCECAVPFGVVGDAEDPYPEGPEG